MPSTKHIVILGSTGSIGRQALDVISAMPSRFVVDGLVANRNVKLLLEQARAFSVASIALLDVEGNRDARRDVEIQAADVGCRTFWGDEGVEELVKGSGAEMVISALVGFAGLKPTLAAIRGGKDIALANKETLVAAGALVTRAVRECHVRLLPVDSEHSALFQCLEGERSDEVKRLILTASGGPFRDATVAQLKSVSVADALSHPTWSMGRKITIDSATLMNKGLEIIEAHWLFGVGVDKIDVVLHPQSVVHSLVEFVDGSVKAQLGMPDMRLPILYALCYPERVENSRIPEMNLLEHSPLTFQPPDASRFHCLRLAKEALQSGGTMPAVMNAANEVAVERFLSGKIGFMGIPDIVEKTMARHNVTAVEPELEEIHHADGWARECATQIS